MAFRYPQATQRHSASHSKAGTKARGLSMAPSRPIPVGVQPPACIPAIFARTHEKSPEKAWKMRGCLGKGSVEKEVGKLLSGLISEWVGQTSLPKRPLDSLPMEWICQKRLFADCFRLICEPKDWGAGPCLLLAALRRPRSNITPPKEGISFPCQKMHEQQDGSSN